MTTATEKGMDLAQAVQRIVWLDEERRRDRSELARLTQESTNVLAMLKDQTIKLREFGDRLASLESALTRIARLEDSVTLARSEIAQAREADQRVQEDMRRQARDRQAQAEQGARVLADMTARAESLGKAADALTARLQVLETREREHAERMAILQSQLLRLESERTQASDETKRILARHDAVLADIQRMRKEFVTAQDQHAKIHKEDAARIAADKESLAALQRQIDGLRGDSQAMAHQLDHLDTSAAESKDAIAGLHQQSEEILAHSRLVDSELDNLQKSAAESKDAIAAMQQQMEELVSSTQAAASRLDHLEEASYQASEGLKRLGALEEQMAVVEAANKGFQETQDARWGVEIPELRRLIEESHQSSQANAAAVQELAATAQALKEEVRQLQTGLVDGRTYSEELAAQIRHLLEEEAQGRLAEVQRLVQGLRKLAQEEGRRQNE